ncbi:hypothetical protein PHISP_03490 [Aspergillus sp. HF37]|nr:hypothetical protein PHISP_03490 [Aspergillus sp. HF37]
MRLLRTSIFTRAARLDFGPSLLRTGRLELSFIQYRRPSVMNSISRQRRHLSEHSTRAKDTRQIRGDGDSQKPSDSTANGSQSGQTELNQRGKLITTPSRLFKLVVPLTTTDRTPHRDVEPIAILVHPQQPLSHLERLIQSELHPMDRDDSRCRLPSVSFTAPQQDDTAVRPRQVVHEGTDTKERGTEGDRDAVERRKTRKETRERPFVRWAQSTEVGDFVRDASQVQEFVMTIESDKVRRIRVMVPSFDERTRFLRMRLRKLSRRIEAIARVKYDCDALARRGARRVAIGGFGVLASWWYIVYRITFETDLGWDTMEPVTYLASLSTLMGGYLWFLYHNREISYRSALDFTISARQKKLYQAKGVDLGVWESLVDEGNALRKEIKTIAAEYDVEWDERGDEQNEKVTEALKTERHHKNGTNHRSSDKEDKDD